MASIPDLLDDYLDAGWDVISVCDGYVHLRSAAEDLIMASVAVPPQGGPRSPREPGATEERR